MRALLTDSVLASLRIRDDSAAQALRQELQREMMDHQAPGRTIGGLDALRLEAVGLQRQLLWRMRRQCEVGEEVFRLLEQELDLHELASMRKLQLELIDS